LRNYGYFRQNTQVELCSPMRLLTVVFVDRVKKISNRNRNQRTGQFLFNKFAVVSFSEFLRISQMSEGMQQKQMTQM